MSITKMLISPSNVMRFWRAVEKTEGCWLWTKSKSKRYGYIKVDGSDIAAHRFSWIIRHGSIPDGLKVLHRCDVTKCVRPDHLFLGTQMENIADMMQKGRNNQPKGLRNGKYTKPESTPRGEKHGAAKLGREDAESILLSSETQVELAHRFGVSQAVVSAIKLGKIWKSLNRAAQPSGYAAGSRNAGAKLTEADAIDILRSTENQPTMAARYGVNQSVISNIRRRKAWRHLTSP